MARNLHCAIVRFNKRATTTHTRIECSTVFERFIRVVVGLLVVNELDAGQIEVRRDVLRLLVAGEELDSRLGPIVDHGLVDDERLSVEPRTRRAPAQDYPTEEFRHLLKGTTMDLRMLL